MGPFPPLAYRLIYKLVKRFQKDNPLEYQNLFLADHHDMRIDFIDKGMDSKFYIGNDEYFLKNDSNFLILCHCTYTINWPVFSSRIHFRNNYNGYEKYMRISSGTMDFVNEILVPLTGILHTSDMCDLSFEWIK